MQSLGFTRTSVRPDHALITPDTFVRAPLPGWTNSTHVVHVAPVLGAQFTMYTAEMEPKGKAAPADIGVSRFVYVVEGKLKVNLGGKRAQTLGPGHYLYLPPESEARLEAALPTQLTVIEKPYMPQPDTDFPQVLVGHESGAPASFLGGDPHLVVRTLLPDGIAFDMAVNTMTYQPGATLPLVEVHVMEHGLQMLEGGGIYRLSDQWYPVTRGDFIYMAPYCPQWFGALGKEPAKYLIYKDWNRHPLD